MSITSSVVLLSQLDINVQESTEQRTQMFFFCFVFFFQNCKLQIEQGVVIFNINWQVPPE